MTPQAGGPTLLRRWWRRARRRLRRRPVTFVYSRLYRMELPGVPHDPLRAEHILTFLAGEGLLARGAVQHPYPVALKWLRQVHAEAYLEAVHDTEALTRVLGFPISDARLDRLLQLQRSMVGGTMLATRVAQEGSGVAVNLGGGLHHAFADRGERFCVFNDVAAAIRQERARGFAGRILVVDLDLHDGDGTRTIFADDPTVHTYSIHNLTTASADAVAATVVELGDDVGDATFLAALRDTLPSVFAAFRPELVVYLCGADAAAGDEIGNWRLTADGLLERDRLVWDLARPAASPRPLVVTLAGGYGAEAWRYSARFFAWMILPDDPPEPPTTEAVTLARYRRLARLLEPSDLSRESDPDDWGLSAEDVYGALAGAGPRTRLLGYYTRHGIELALERAGILDRLRSLGYERPTLELELDHPGGETVRLWGDGERRALVFELRARRDRRSLPGLELLGVEWLLLQNPRGAFTEARPRLPGQHHPGLGLLRDVCALLVLVCERLGLDGILFTPSHYHLAAQSHSLLRFLRPEDEALYRALQGALRGVPLAEAERALEDGRVRDPETGEPVAWRPEPMVLPVSPALTERVTGEAYERRVEAAGHRLVLETGAPRPRGGQRLEQ